MTNPELLQKVRSPRLLKAVEGMPCFLMLGSFLGLPCEPDITVVPCHIRTIGKGQRTKVSDIFVTAGCRLCHDLMDLKDLRAIAARDSAGRAWEHQILRAMCATQSRLIELGIIRVEGAELV